MFTRLNDLIDVLKKLTQNEFSLFKTWLKYIVSKRFPKRQQKKMKDIIDKTSTREVDDMISNFGRNIEEFIKEGRKKGKLDGEKKKSMEIARNLLNDRMPTDLIAKYTGLTPDEIRQIKEEDN